MNQIDHRRVQFRICDVYLPEPAEILAALHGENVLEGTVVARSEGAPAGPAFVVVEVKEIPKPLVVPADRIREVA